MATVRGLRPGDVWRQLSEELALPGIHIPEQYGGAGFGMVELCIVTEELGRALLCAPYFSTTVLAANAVLNAGTEVQKSGLAAGPREWRAARNAGDNRAQAAVGIRRDRAYRDAVADGYRLDGVKSYVVDGTHRRL